MQTVESDIITELDISHIITEDDTPVDNLFSEHQQRLLAESLSAGWEAPDKAPFLAAANVGVFYGLNIPPVVPDVFVSFNVAVPQNVWEKRHRSYFVWEYGKPPEIVVEVVSNLVGGELSDKLTKYAQVGVIYYIVYDPAEHYGKPPLRVFALHRGRYVQLESTMFEEYGLGVTLWQGSYGSMTEEWLRWCYPDGTLVPTGRERALEAESRADKAESRADKAESRADKAESRAERLAKKLRALGMNPDDER